MIKPYKIFKETELVEELNSIYESYPRLVTENIKNIISNARIKLKKLGIRYRYPKVRAYTLFYFALNLTETPLTMQEIINMGDNDQINKTSLGRDVKRLNRVLLKNDRFGRYNKTKLTMKDYVIKYLPKLDLSISQREELLRKVDENLLFNISGNSPPIIAGSFIYLVSLNLGYNLTQKDIARVVGCSEVGLRNNIRLLKDILLKGGTK